MTRDSEHSPVPTATFPDSTAVRSTRRDLLESGRRLFARRGFDGTSVRAITADAEANLGAVTYHFGSKRGLYSAVLEDGLAPIAEKVARAGAAEGTARERLLQVVEAYFEHLGENPDLPHLLLQEVAAGKPAPPVVLEIIRAVMATLAAVQQDGLEDGSLRPGHPILTALSVVSQPIYLTLIAPLLKQAAGIDLAQADHRAMALEHILRFVNAGLEPHGEATP